MDYVSILYIVMKISCKGTESFLTKKYLHNLATLQGAVEALSNEIAPVALPAGNSPQYRKNLAINLFYKVITQ